ncbi:hypothetical protein [Permianibacter aggregans]|uniref:Uncharacterized protein n=1 Tax=Permianibacter aggregans TaxID=1510150 RepID=A0A4R6UKL9_9GAMM|nr:hypothetical protein [Permianibacter aggregans]QGX40171.1 hypothetical protein E2H98_11010 [Permianibacter aggregans]TDQ47421.1 hypothetical protein EV696_11013 [Permianibacter aggregans]
MNISISPVILTATIIAVAVLYAIYRNKTKIKKNLSTWFATFAFILGFLSSTLIELNANGIEKLIEDSFLKALIGIEGVILTAVLIVVALALGIGFTYKKSESDEEYQEVTRKALETAKEILTESPPRHFINSFSTHYFYVYQQYRSTIDEIIKYKYRKADKDGRILTQLEILATLASTIRIIQKSLLHLVKSWDENPGAEYRASLMLYHPTNTLIKNDIAPTDIGLHFFDPDVWPNGNTGVLLLLTDLTTALPVDAVERDERSESAATDGQAFVFSLPVRNANRDRRKAALDRKVRNLPGGPCALAEGFDWLHSRTNVIDRCASFDQIIQEQVKEYFSPKNETTLSICSFVSMGLRRAQTQGPIGVINLVSDADLILDTEKKAKSFYNLATPYLLLLGELAWQFRDLGTSNVETGPTKPGL